MLITFSGLDGAGKSTLIEWLRTTLERRDRPVAVFHMNDHVGLYAYLRAVRDRLVWREHHENGAGSSPAAHAGGASGSEPGRAPERPRHSLRARVRCAIVWNKPVRRLIYPLDVLVFLLYRIYVERLTKRVLIMDRYFYDTLVDVADGRSWRWIRWLQRITPTPTVPVFLDITPEEAYARKGEYTVAYLRTRWVAYQEVFRWLPSAVLLANDDVSETKAALEEVVMERIAAP